MSYRRPRNSPSTRERQAADLRTPDFNDVEVSCRDSDGDPNSTTIFELGRMCVDCPALAGLDREAFEPCGGGRMRYAPTLRVDKREPVSVWSKIFSAKAGGIPVGNVSVALYGIPGQVFEPREDAFIHAANSAVEQCSGPQYSQPDSDQCGTGDRGLLILRKYEEPTPAGQSLVRFATPPHKRT